MRKNHITKYEQETSLLYNRAEPDAVIFTYEPALKRRLAKYAKAHPDIARMLSEEESGAVCYRIDKKRVAIRLTAPYSDERRKQMSEQAKQNGFQTKRQSNPL